ncbi:uncharacterized protein SPSC_10003 [Sporisorium scitamineum]|uniref:Effector family protein Eff1 n=1 Tax=Sporisorium scitamineum TaxID=49012 RepID=A0A127ZIY5_9BASI|nr:uncharacterized protein SPSC_10003 [Sporisorium scitamineum]
MFVSLIKLCISSPVLACCLVSAVPMWQDPRHGYRYPDSSQRLNAAQTLQGGGNHAQGGHFWNGHEWVPVYAQPQPAILDEVPFASSSTRSDNRFAPVAEGMDQVDSRNKKSQLPVRQEQTHWPAPASFRRLEMQQAMGNSKIVTTVLFYKDADEVQRRINSQLFDDKIAFVPTTRIQLKDGGWRKRSPLNLPSRPLPPISISGSSNEKVYVYMTEHGLADWHNRIHKGGPFGDKPRYFWKFRDPGGISVPENRIEFLGAGYINKEDNEAVDNAIYRALCAMEQAPHAHV